MQNNPISGAAYLLRGFSLLNRSGVRRYVIVPLLINIVLFAALLTFAGHSFGNLIDHLLPQLPHWLTWLSWLLWLLFALTAVILIFFLFTLIANLIASPFNAYLAEAVEYRLTGHKPDSGLSLLGEIRHAVLSELRKYAYYLLWMVPLLVAFLIPGLNLIAPFLWALFGAWMLAVQYADYPMGNHGLGFPEQRKVLREKRWLSLGFGGATMLATLIPVVNFLVMPAAVAGATALWIERWGVDHLEVDHLGTDRTVQVRSGQRTS